MTYQRSGKHAGWHSSPEGAWHSRIAWSSRLRPAPPQQVGHEQVSTPASSLQTSKIPTQTLAPRQSQVARSPQPAGRSTQYVVRPPRLAYCTHACPADASQAAQSSTETHSVAGTHGPQHIPRTLGTSPAPHRGGSISQATASVSQV